MPYERRTLGPRPPNLPHSAERHLHTLPGNVSLTPPPKAQGGIAYGKFSRANGKLARSSSVSELAEVQTGVYYVRPSL